MPVGLLQKYLDYRKKRLKSRGRTVKFSQLFEAAAFDRLNADWRPGNYDLNSSLRSSMRQLRANSRHLAINNPYARRFIGMAENHVVGPPGIRLQSMARMQTGERAGELDETGAQKVEDAFQDWSSPANCTVTGKLSFRDAQQLTVKSWLTDGELLARKIRGFPNPYAFALQFHDPDECPLGVNDKDLNVKLGIEFDEWERPKNYLMLDESSQTVIDGRKVRRIPAAEIIHLFITERPGQVRGIPHMVSTMQRIRMLDAVDEAYVVGTRIAASKMGFYRSENGAPVRGADSENSEGQQVFDLSPGSWEQIGHEESIETFDPDYPPTGYDVFRKEILRSVAGGWSVGYNSLANDLEGVNYSSIRWGGLDERDVFRGMQNFLIEHFCRALYPDWLLMAMTTGALDLPLSRYQKFLRHSWQPRGWQYVDPTKEAQGSAQKIALGGTTFSQVAAEQGGDFRENIVNQEREIAFANSHNITLPRDGNASRQPQRNPNPNGQQRETD